MKTWIIPVTWQEIGTVEIEAGTLEQAIYIAKNDDTIPLPKDGEFLDGTWEVDCEDVERVREIYNWNKQDEKPKEFKEVMHARWKKATDNDAYWYECSACGSEIPKDHWGSDKFSAYCPECGAKMDEEIK